MAAELLRSVLARAQADAGRGADPLAWFDAGYLVESLRLFDEAGDVSGYALVLDTLAIAAIRTGDRERAARISGAVTRLEQESGTGLNAWNRDILAFDPEELRLDPALADAWAEGEAFSREQAVAYALQA